MKKWLANVFLITSAGLILSLAVSLLHSDKVAETVPPSPNSITVSSGM